MLPYVIWMMCCCWGLTNSQSTDTGSIKEYCQWETFNATCPEGQVIMMTSAKYGRMRIGRCLPIDYHMGCSADILDHADERCSGKRFCSIYIPDNIFFNVQNCRKDLVAYFEAGYQCVPVIDPYLEEKMFCRNTIDISNYEEGYISSAVSAATSLGSSRCPWQIKAQPGQKINMTLLDFSTRSPTSLPAPGSSSRNSSLLPCPVHAVLEDGDNLFGKSSTTLPVHICGQGARRKWLYTSRNNTLKVKMVDLNQHTINTVTFLLHFKVIGCADISPLEQATIVRKGESLKISCDESQEKWHLVCKGTTWIGEYHNCSSTTHQMSMGDTPGDDQGFPLGLLIAIAIGVIVGVVLGFVFLIAIFVCRKRSRREFKNDSGNPLMGTTPMEPDPNIYRLVEVRPPASMMCDCQYTPGLDHKTMGTLDSKLIMPPGECIYRASPRIERGECLYQARDGDIYQPQNVTPLKTCDIISDIHVPDSPPFCPEGQDGCNNSQYGVTNDNNHPRIPPFPGFTRGERGTITRLHRPSTDSGSIIDACDTPIYQSR